MGSVVNSSLSVLPLAARTASVNSPDFRNRHHRGVRVHINVTADPAASDSLTYEVTAELLK